jgi:3-deoxy-7-phosphoheptulonate synthase
MNMTNQNTFKFICGPCAIESKEQMESVLDQPFAPRLIRGGVFKLRSQRASFQGLGVVAVELMMEIKKTRPFTFITEVTDPRQIELLDKVTDVFQVGARNMYNYELLKELANWKKPVVLKRGFSATTKEWLGATEYMQELGEENIILCERGVRNFDSNLRNMLDLGTVIYLKHNHPFKVLVDPSHALGLREYIPDAVLASLAAGADGVMVETHPNPDSALSDGRQSLDYGVLSGLVNRLKELTPLFNKKLEV